MPETMRISEPDTGHTIILDDNRRDLVLVELQRVRRFGAPYPKESPPVAADLILEIEDDGRTRRYVLLSETVLLDTERRRVYQFYMGLQLLQWLNAP
ncbi:MAG: hypothetical protein WBX11_08905 [Thiobacillaceae bacterium]|jgi:hypothetical protein